jgi:hypothetical protein
MIKVEGHKNLYRDENSGAIINCNSTEYQKNYEKKELNELRKELDELKKLVVNLSNDFH